MMRSSRHSPRVTVEYFSPPKPSPYFCNINFYQSVNFPKTMPYFLSFINSAINYCIFPFFLQVLSEYVGGGDLSLHLKKGGMPVAQLREYTQQLVEALCYLHSRAVVHKDLRVSETERCLFINSLHILPEIINFFPCDYLLLQIHSSRFVHSYLVAALTLTEIFDWPITVLGKGEFYLVARVYKFVFTQQIC